MSARTPELGDRGAREIREEIRFYLDERTRELVEEGMSEADARRTALAAFGDLERIQAEVEAIDGADGGWNMGWRQWMVAAVRDARYAGRGLVKSPGFTLIALLTLTVGLGANTAMYSLVHATLFAGPAVDDPHELVAVYTTSRRGFPRSSTSYPDFLDYREQATLLEGLAGTSTLPASLGADTRGARFVSLLAVTGNYFDVLGVDVELGRALAPDDDRLGAGAPVLVLSHALWVSHFAADADVVGSDVRLNGRPFVVVGVARPDFTGLSLDARPDAWLPMQAGARLGVGAIGEPDVWESRGARWMGMSVGRMAPGASVERVAAQFEQISERMKETWGPARGTRDTTVDALTSYALPAGSEEQVARFVWLLLGVVGFTLLLACANLANLLLARATSRTREVAVRLAMGAGRADLVRQLTIESGALALAGGLLGLGFAEILLRALGSFQLPGGLAIASLGAGLDRPVLLFTLALCLLTSVLFGLVPTLQASRPDVVHALKGHGAGGAARSGDRLRKGLVGTQVALCLILMIGSGLFVRTMQAGMSADLGFDPDGVAIARVNLGLLEYEAPEATAFLDALRARLGERPSIDVVSVSTRVPLQEGGARGFFAEVPGYGASPDEEMRIDLVAASSGYFESLAMPILEGRPIGDGDVPGAQQVVVINRAMADRYWGESSPVGRTLLLGDQEMTVVGVAEDVSWSSLAEEPTNFVFYPLAMTADWTTGFVTVAVRTTGDPGEALTLLRAEMNALEADAPITVAATMDDQLREALTAQQTGAVLLSGFGLLALLLASLGIVGVVAYTVNRQRRDIGIRMALGAASASVVGQVSLGLAIPVGLGLAAGIGGAALLARFIETFLFGVDPLDAGTYAAVTVGLVIITALATLVPASRATWVQPIEVLRAD